MNIKPSSKQKTSIPKERRPLFQTLNKIILKKLEEKRALEAFLFCSQAIEVVLIPELVEFLITQLKIKDHFSIFSKGQFSTKTLVYFALSQDAELFGELEEFRRIRNRIIHSITSYDSLEDLDKESVKGVELYLNIDEKVELRLIGKTPIPVLQLFLSGIKHERERVQTTLNKLRAEIELELKEAEVNLSKSLTRFKKIN